MKTSKFKPLIYSAALVLVLGCNEQADKKPEYTEPTPQLSLDDFKGIPVEVKGCVCYFSETDEKFKNEEYIFAADFDSLGFVAVDDKVIELKLVRTGQVPYPFGDNDHIEVYNSELYKVTVDIKYKNSTGEKTWWNDGTVTIENKDGEKVMKNFVGQCGC